MHRQQFLGACTTWFAFTTKLFWRICGMLNNSFYYSRHADPLSFDDDHICFDTSSLIAHFRSRSPLCMSTRGGFSSVGVVHVRCGADIFWPWRGQLLKQMDPKTFINEFQIESFNPMCLTEPNTIMKGSKVVHDEILSLSKK